MTEATLSLEKKHANTIFRSSSYQEVVDALNASIQGNTSVIVLTGESGTGKTLIARNILRNLINEKHRIFFQDPRISVGEMANLTYGHIGVAPPDLQAALGTEKTSETFFNYLEGKSQEGPIRFFIDDAQDINLDTLHSILKFMKSQPGDRRVLQLILIGLPKLKPLLASLKIPELENANPVYLHLAPLDTEEVSAFVAHHLKTTHKQRDDFFSPEVIERITLYTQKIPGLVSKLVDSVSAVMEINGHNTLTADIVDDAVEFFSLPWALENKKMITNQEKEDSNQSAQDASDTNNAMENDSLLSKVSRSLARLFSNKKNDTVGPATEHISGESTAQTANNVSPVLTNESQQTDPAEEGNSENAGIPIKTQENQITHKTADTAPISSLKPNKQINTMNEHETMNRAELLNKALKALQNGSPDVEAVALISEDGLVVASALPQDLDEIRVGGMSATLLSLGTRSSAELRRGNVEEIIVRGEQGYTVMLKAGQGTLLLVVANQNAKLGLIFFDMRETIEKLAKIL